MALVHALWNNKGGSGKTSLGFQISVEYAEKNPDKKVLVIDMCPQANISELLLGSLNGRGSDKLLKIHGQIPRCSIGGYFQLRLPNPYSPPEFNPKDFITHPTDYNPSTPDNLDLVCGDPLLELQANAINSIANVTIPGTNTWLAVIDWINDFLKKIDNEYDIIFIDCNPSFSIYTQSALAASSKLILPVMADDSSRRAIQNVLSLVYGLKLPSDIYLQYAFATKIKEAGRELPKIHLILKNRLTQYMGPASAYAAVLESIKTEVRSIQKDYPEIFTFTDINSGFIDVRDFQTTGVVAFAKGIPFSKLKPGRRSVNGHRVSVTAENKENCEKSIKKIIKRI